MKIMISQPMKNKTIEQIEAERKDIVKIFEQNGYEVIDTIFEEDAPNNCDAGIWYLSKSIEEMSKVDGVFFMKGWKDARGCRIEYQIAKEYGKFIKEEIE